MKVVKKKYIIAILAIFVVLIFIYLAFLNFNWFNKNDSSNEILLLQQLRSEVNEELKTFKMKKILRYRDLILRKENFTQVSNYQKYVTPNNEIIKNYVSTMGIDTLIKAYDTAVDWMWVSDQTLHNVPEKWLLPAEFIEDSPTNPNNPLPTKMVSDCESQAYTLVSIIESININKENVRVVIGEVNFSGEVGGHAWVQIYQDGNWMELEATSGPFWDDDDQTLVENGGFPFNFFKNRPYPVVEYWAFFNDIYFYNPTNGKESQNLPDYWKIN